MSLWLSDLRGQVPSYFCGPMNSEIGILQVHLIVLSALAWSVCCTSPLCAAPIGSISSMEVNVDTLEQVEFIDLADQDGADVFLPCEESPPTPQMSGMSLCFGDLGTIWPELDVSARNEVVGLSQGRIVSRSWKYVFLLEKQLAALI